MTTEVVVKNKGPSKVIVQTVDLPAKTKSKSPVVLDVGKEVSVTVHDTEACFVSEMEVVKEVTQKSPEPNKQT